MYKLESIQRNNSNKITGYIIKDIKSGAIKLLTRNKILELMRLSEIQGLKLSTDNRIIANKGLSSSGGIQIKTGESLLEVIKEHNGYIHRTHVAEIVKKINNYIGQRVIIIGGVRRTGKTVAISHTISQLIKLGVNLEDIILIRILFETVKLDDLYKILQTLKNKIIFIDEVTRINGFVTSAHIFSDDIAAVNKVILSGTDSYSFTNAMRDSLYDRAVYFNFTSLKYTEYLKLFRSELAGLSELAKIDRFMLYGGVLSRAEYDIPTQTYVSIQNALVQNVINTVYNNNSNYRATPEYVKYFVKQDIEKLVYTVIRLILDTCNINREIYNGALKRIDLNKEAYNFVASIVENTKGKLGTTEARKELKDSKYSDITKELVRSVFLVLKELDIVSGISNVTREDTDEIIYSKFGGEFICNVQSILFSILNKVIKNISDSDEYTTEMLTGAINGTLTENLVISQCLQHGYTVSFLRYELTPAGLVKYSETNSTPEIDCVITNHTDLLSEVDSSKPFRVLIEIKHSKLKKTEHAKNLKLSSVEAIMKKSKKLVVYRGETTVVHDIQYVNIHDFLTDIPRWVEQW